MAAWGQGRIEVSVVRDRIATALAEKQPLTSIYKNLSDEGRVSVSYVSFCQNVEKLRVSGELDLLVAPPTTRHTLPTPSSSPRSTPAALARQPLPAAGPPSAVIAPDERRLETSSRSLDELWDGTGDDTSHERTK